MEKNQYTDTSVTVIGKVLKSGRPKKYANKYDNVPITKFFLEVETHNHGIVKAMVITNEDKKSPLYRERPFIGDTVELESMRIKNGWMSVTEKRKYKILSHDGREAWIEQKNSEEKKENEIKNARTEYKNKILSENKENHLNEIKKYFKSCKSTFINGLISDVLKYIDKHGSTIEGIEGHYDSLDMSGNYLGTGLRASPGAPLWNHPKNIRKSVLDEGVKLRFLKITFGEDKETPIYKLTNDGKFAIDKIEIIDKKYTKRSFSIKGHILGYNAALDSDKDFDEILTEIKNSIKSGNLHRDYVSLIWDIEEFVGCKKDSKLNKHTVTIKQQQDIDKIVKNYFKNIESGIRAGLKTRDGDEKENKEEDKNE